VTIVDTGPLVALLNRRDSFHPWARETLGRVGGPLSTCEAVIAESCHLMGRHGAQLVLELGVIGFVTTPFALNAEWPTVQRLMRRYADVPMSFADACLVRMSELAHAATVVTLDSDFSIYRRHGRQVIPVLSPGS
jgi:predicted nucleic acid-binding protein